MTPRHTSSFVWATLAGLLLVSASLAQPRTSVFEGTLLWPEDQREFLNDGPGMLLSREQRGELMNLDAVGREQWIESFMSRDPLPDTEGNELPLAIERRRALARDTIGSFQDARARVLFLHGTPDDRFFLDCAETYQPVEVWTYSDRPHPAIFYQERSDKPFTLWLPLEGKRVLYTEEMVYYLEQWEELKNRIRGGKRIDRFFCKDSKKIDELTGIDGLFGFEEYRPKDADIASYLDRPELADWAREAVTTPASDVVTIEGARLEVLFPERQGQRIVTRMQVIVDDPNQLEVFTEGDNRQLRLVVEGTLERPDNLFEEFRVRFQVPYPEEGLDQPVALQAERPLRPGSRFLLRLKVTDEISGHVFHTSRGLLVAQQPTAVAEPAATEQTLVAIGQDLAAKTLQGYDSLILIPPVSDVVFGLWRAEALVTGTAIEKVKFFLDEKLVLSRKSPPFTAELRLDTYPREQTVRIEGLDADDELVASDQVILNQPRGELRVRIIDPVRGTSGIGTMDVSAEIVVPEEKHIEKVEVKVNEEVQQVLTQPPWKTQIEIPAALSELTYITVAAHLDDGLTAEAVRFINAPDYIDEINVDLVELYTTVTDRSGSLAQGLGQEDFSVAEDGRPQEIAKFELVDDLPLSLGITIDTSGSMFESLGEAQRAAISFLEQIITPRDRCFAVSFSDQPEILMPRTSDVGAVSDRLGELVADGMTALHDAVVTSLYYYRGIRGRRALVLLSDGEDTASSLSFKESLEYAKRSGVSIYTIGLRIGKLDFSVRNKLDALSNETGGRAFYINEAEELRTVYAEIEKELRSQYLVAYSSDSTKPQDEFRTVEVEVKGGKLKARTISGYYP